MGAFVRFNPSYTQESKEQIKSTTPHWWIFYITSPGIVRVIHSFSHPSRAGWRGSSENSDFLRYQTIRNLLVLFCFRVFGPSALIVSFYVRWNLICIGYEAFILSLYGFMLWLYTGRELVVYVCLFSVLHILKLNSNYYMRLVKAN